VIRRARTFTTVLSVLMTPLIFLSGLMFPVAAMPGWMAWLTLADPLTYAVDAMRAAIGTYQPHRTSALFTPVSWGGLHPGPALELAAVAAFTVLALTIAARRFARTG
jgi:ABC-2 type transport system permease protein